MSDPRDDVAATFALAAEKLERAAAHCRIAGMHYTNREVPRGCAHAFAALGDLMQARAAIDENASVHASKAQIDLDPG
ncbi:MAG: hypothetical protein PVF57_09170 [Pseudomonadales bacterium]|jgi:hypothetical protein